MLLTFVLDASYATVDRANAAPIFAAMAFQAEPTGTRDGLLAGVQAI